MTHKYAVDCPICNIMKSVRAQNVFLRHSLQVAIQPNKKIAFPIKILIEDTNDKGQRGHTDHWKDYASIARVKIDEKGKVIQPIEKLDFYQKTDDKIIEEFVKESFDYVSSINSGKIVKQHQNDKGMFWTLIDIKYEKSVFLDSVLASMNKSAEVIPQNKMKEVYESLSTPEKHYTKNDLTFDYVVATEDTKIDTEIDGKKETKNVAHSGDYILTGSKGEKYVLTKKKFDDRYVDLGKGKAKSKPVKIQAKEFEGKPIDFMASWGEKMIIEPGDMLVFNGTEYYRIEKGAFKNTYHQGSKAVVDNYDDILKTITDLIQKKEIIKYLNKNPKLAVGLRKYLKNTLEQMKSFNNNSVTETLLQKLSEGKKLGYYDFM